MSEPYIVKFEGVEIHMLDGKFHRIGGPAITIGNTQEWLVNGEYHRDDGPARMYKDKGNHIEFWQNGKPIMNGKVDEDTFAKHWHTK